MNYNSSINPFKDNVSFFLCVSFLSLWYERLYVTPECFQIQIVQTVFITRSETIHLQTVSLNVEDLELGIVKLDVLAMNMLICVGAAKRSVGLLASTLNL